MYRVLEIPRKTLICSDEIIAIAGISSNIDIRFLNSSIQLAEERFIKNAICKDLYYDFRDRKNVVVTSINKVYLQTLMDDEQLEQPVELNEGDIVNSIDFLTIDAYKTFWFEHLWRLIAEAVVYVASPNNYSRFEAQGEMENNPANIINEGKNSVSVPLATLQWKMDKMLQDRVSPSLTAMEEWMYDNSVNFPYYNCKKFIRTQDNNGVAISGKTGWITGLYDKINKKPCYGCTDRY